MTWLVVFEREADDNFTYAYDISDDGTTVVGEAQGPGSGPQHGWGVCWARTSLMPPVWVRRPIVALSGTNKDNPAVGISGDARLIVGFNTYKTSPPGHPTWDSQAYAELDGVTQPGLLFSSPSHITAIARNASNNGQIAVGYASHDTAIHDRRCTAMTWEANAAGVYVPSSFDRQPGRPSSARGWDVTGNGNAIVGEGFSSDAAAANPDDGSSSEALLWRRVNVPNFNWRRIWLGFPAGPVNNSVAYAVSSVGSPSGDLVIVGASGGSSRIARQNRERRPVFWRSKGLGVIGNQLDLLKRTFYVPRDTTTGTALNVTKDGRCIVGMCASVDVSLDDNGSELEDWFPHATIWGWDPFRAWSIDEILRTAGVPVPSDLTLASASGISGDGKFVCGYGYNSQSLVGWVAMLPPFPIKPGIREVDVPRTFPNFVRDPLLSRIAPPVKQRRSARRKGR